MPKEKINYSDELIQSLKGENAPDELKEKYSITLPEAYNILPDNMLPDDLKGKNEHWDIFKDCCNLRKGESK